MSKNENIRTMATILEELNTSVDNYNELTDNVKKAELSIEHKKLCEEYNQLSLLKAYADFLKDETPILALAKAYYYDTISVKDAVHNETLDDGTMTSNVMRSVNSGCKKLDVIKFIEWTEEKNKSVAEKKGWKSEVAKTRTVIETEWKKFFKSKGDTHSMSIGKTKKALQEMFDTLIFIKTETGKNAIIANGDIAKWVLAFANTRNDSKVDGTVKLTGEILSKRMWNVLLLDILHKAVTGKSFDIVYGEETPELTATNAEKPEAETDKKNS